MNILRKLTIKNLRLNKIRTLMTILGITLSISLITVIIGLITGAWKSMVNSEIQTSGDYSVKLYAEFRSENDGGFNEEFRRTIENNRMVERAEVLEYVTAAKNPYPKKSYQPFICIMSLTPSAYQANNCTLQSGRYPENDDELLLTSSFRRYTDREYKVGDVLELETGKRYAVGNVGEDDLPSEMVQTSFPAYSFYQDDEHEIFRSDGKKKYTVVGILDNEGGIMNELNYQGANAFTYSAPVYGETMYIKFTDENETDCRKALAQLLGIDEELFRLREELSGSDVTNEDLEKAAHLSAELGKYDIGNFSVNNSMIRARHLFYEGMSNEERTAIHVIILTVIIIISIIIFASIFIIRNSFAISVTEKTKLYGMLSSVGATPRQIRHSVFFEAFVLGAVGIPLGMLLGVGVTAGLVGLVNELLSDYLSGIKLEFFIPFYAAAGIVCLGLFTVAMSALTSALSASKISPLDAIRSSRFINVRRAEKEKNYKVPGFIKKLFGTGGCISWKNMKRSRKQYSTTVLSIVISVAVYIAASTFVDYNIASIQYRKVDIPEKYGLEAELYGSESSKIRSKLNTVVSADGVKEYCYYVRGEGYHFGFDKNDIPEETLNSPDFPQTIIDPDGNAYIYMQMIAVDNETFGGLCRSAGKSFEECRYKGFMANKFMVYDSRGLEKGALTISKSLSDITVSGFYEEEKYPEDYYYDEDGNYQGTEPEIVRHEMTVDIAGEIGNDFELPFGGNAYGYIFVTVDWFEKKGMSSSMGLVEIDAADTNSVEDYLNEIKESEGYDSSEENYVGISTVFNRSKYINSIKSSVVVVKIFVYGFITVIVLIGLTNIFNTITTNMNMRRKEFAMLCSVGMMNKEFSRMIRLESLLYTLKSLMFGVPLGLLLSGGLMLTYKYGNPEMFESVGVIFPWKAILASLAAVLVVLWIIMKFSLVKIRKQNIIETIRNDNI